MIASASMRVYGEMERATRPGRVGGKLDKYAGHFLRLCRDDSRVEFGAILVCHHDPRRDATGRERRPGDGAEHLAASLRDDLYSGARPHFRELQDYLQNVDGSLDIGRIIAVQDWDEVRRQGIGARCYTLAPFVGADGQDVYEVSLYDVAREYERITERVRTYVHAGRRR